MGLLEKAGGRLKQSPAVVIGCGVAQLLQSPKASPSKAPLHKPCNEQSHGWRTRGPSMDSGSLSMLSMPPFLGPTQSRVMPYAAYMQCFSARHCQFHLSSQQQQQQQTRKKFMSLFLTRTLRSPSVLTQHNHSNSTPPNEQLQAMEPNSDRSFPEGPSPDDIYHVDVSKQALPVPTPLAVVDAGHR
jgi:hypothetical protein